MEDRLEAIRSRMAGRKCICWECEAIRFLLAQTPVDPPPVPVVADPAMLTTVLMAGTKG